jgi:hypothetical protein
MSLETVDPNWHTSKNNFSEVVLCLLTSNKTDLHTNTYAVCVCMWRERERVKFD